MLIDYTLKLQGKQNKTKTNKTNKTEHQTKPNQTKK